jgi:hypothetical protein
MKEDIQSYSQRLGKVLAQIQIDMQRERGFSGPFAHIGQGDECTLTLSSGDFGDIILSVKDRDGVRGYSLEDSVWHPATVNTNMKGFNRIVKWAEKVNWEDRLQGSE